MHALLWISHIIYFYWIQQEQEANDDINTE